jgi:hypothetical protein
VAPPSQVLVWGATSTDLKPLFETGTATGPQAGAFRIAVRDVLRERFGAEGLEVCFSEDDEKHGHHPLNPGFYEPLQLRNSRMVVLLLPGDRAMAVNTWELALACETEPNGDPTHIAKLTFIVPQSLYQYLGTAMINGVHDLADFCWTEPGDEPILGAQNSFAARWIYRIAPKRFADAKESGNPSDILAITYYDDKSGWILDSVQGKELLGKIVNFAVAHLPV